MSEAITISVVCPHCEAQAQVTKPDDTPAVIACPGCDFRHTQVIDQRLRYGMQRIYAGAVDPYFGLALWEE